MYILLTAQLPSTSFGILSLIRSGNIDYVNARRFNK